MPVKDLKLNLIPSMRKVDIHAKRKVLSKILEGIWSTMLKGHGMEFAGFRQYTYGDDASRIDWNATLRAKQTLVREFEEYKTVNVFFLLDVSSSMLFTSTERLKCEYAAELLFNFSTAVLDAGDSVGYALYANDIITHQIPTVGRELIYRMAQDLSDGNNYGGRPDFKHAMLLCRQLLPHPCLIILISDFVDLPQGWEQYVKMYSMEFDLIGVMVRDPHDYRFPEVGVQAFVQDPANPRDKLLVDVKQYAAAFNAEAAAQERHIQNVFNNAKAGFLKIDTTDDYMDSMISYFRKRGRHIRE